MTEAAIWLALAVWCICMIGIPVGIVASRKD